MFWYFCATEVWDMVLNWKLPSSTAPATSFKQTEREREVQAYWIKKINNVTLNSRNSIYLND